MFKIGLGNYRSILAFAHDVVAVMLAWFLAYWARANFALPLPLFGDFAGTLLWLIPLQATSFLGFGLYRGLWRYASLHDVQRIIGSIVLVALAIPLVKLMFQVEAVVPRSVLLLYPVFLIVLMGGSRLIYRAWKEHRIESIFAALGEPVLVLGAGDTGVRLVKELMRSQEWRVVGFLDDDIRKQGLVLHKVKVLGPTIELAKWAKQFGLRQVIIAMPSASHGARLKIAHLCAEVGLKVLTVPAYEDLISGRVAVTRIRQLEVDDLLGRDPVRLDNAALNGWLNQQVVLVTGAGGSIGSELCVQVAKFRPRQLILFELSEYALYQVEQRLLGLFPDLNLVPLIGDVRNAAWINKIVQKYSPSVIFHAAAYKHVPLMEQENAWEALSNNAYGTYVLANAARECGVPKFVLISTDKAVEPTSVMGASKRLAEMLCQMLRNGPTCFITVRFGNVLGSTGSVIPKFAEQIAQGGPVTVTHPEMTRYFMSIAEAAQLVLQAGLVGQGGDVLILDMGQPVKIYDLAKDMIRLTAVDPAKVNIVFSGLRPGEKMHEKLFANEEAVLATPHPKLRIVRPQACSPEHLLPLVGWLGAAQLRSIEEVQSQLMRWIPDYQCEGDFGELPYPTSAVLPSSPLLH